MEANRSKKHLLKYPYLIRWSCLKWPEYPIKIAIIEKIESGILITTGMVWPVNSDKMESAFRACLHGGGEPQVGEVTRLSI